MFLVVVSNITIAGYRGEPNLSATTAFCNNACLREYLWNRLQVSVYHICLDEKQYNDVTCNFELIMICRENEV